MPSFLFNEQTPTIQPYQAPTELALKAGMYRDAKFKEGLQNIRSKYDNLLSLQLTNPGNQQFVRDQIKTAVDQLDKYTTADLSLPENVGSVMSVFDPVTNDQAVMQDLAFTQHMNKQKSLIEKLSIDAPSKVAPSNVFPILQAEQQYRSSDRNARPNYATFQPYYAYEKDDDGFLSKLKEDVYSDPKTLYVTDPVTGQPITMRGEREVKTIAANKIRGAIRNSFDARKMSQMQLDYQYNMANGMYSPQRASEGLNQDILSLKSTIESAKRDLNTLGLTAADRDTTQKLIDSNTAELTKLSKMREGLLINPEIAKQYFSFGKFMDSYVEQKVNQYTTRQEGKLNFFEPDVENQKFILNTHLEDLKARYKAQAAAAKAKTGTSINPETGLQEDGSYAYEPPLKGIIDLVSQTGNAQLDTNSPYIDALLGTATRDKDNNIIYNLTGGGGLENPDKAIILKDASGSIDPEGVKTLTVNGAIGESIGKLKKLDPETFSNKGRKTSSGIGYGRFLEDNPQYTSTPMSDSEATNTLGQLLTQYQTNPASVNQKFVPVLSALDKQLKENGVNSIDASTNAQYNEFINSDKGKSLINFGVLLNSAGKGSYKFIPDGSNNIVGMSNNRMGVSGYLEMDDAALSRMGLNESKVKKMIEDGVLTTVAPDISYQDTGKKVERASVPKYWLNAVLPVSGNPQAINDKMFEDGDIKNIELKERYNAKRLQSNAFKDYQSNMLVGQAQLEPNGTGAFKPKANSSIDQQVQNLIKTVREDKNVRPEQARAVEEDYNRLIATPQTRADLIRNLQSFMTNVNNGLRQVSGNTNTPKVGGGGANSALSTEPPGTSMNDIPEPTGNWATDLRNELAYRESRGQYDIVPPVDPNTGKPISSAAGRYQFLWNTYKDQIKNVTGIQTKQEFLKDPTAQENFYSWYEQQFLIPGVERLQKYNNSRFDRVQLGKLFHFRGEQGAIDYLQGKVSDKPESYNSSISDYLKPLTKRS